MSFLDSIMIFHLVFSITRAATQQSRRVVGRHLPTSHERARGPGYPESAPPASRLKLTSAVSSSHAATLGRGVQDWTAGRMRKGRVSAPELQRKMGPSPILEPRHKPTGPPQPLQNPHSEFIRSIDRCACAHWCPTLCDPMDCSPPWNLILEWGCHIRLQEIFLTQGSNSILLRLLYQQADSLPLRHLGSPSVYRWGMVNRSKDGFPPITRRECVSVSAGQNDLLQGLLLPGAPLTPATFQVTQKKVQSNTHK